MSYYSLHIFVLLFYDLPGGHDSKIWALPKSFIPGLNCLAGIGIMLNFTLRLVLVVVLSGAKQG